MRAERIDMETLALFAVLLMLLALTYAGIGGFVNMPEKHSDEWFTLAFIAGGIAILLSIIGFCITLCA